PGLEEPGRAAAGAPERSEESLRDVPVPGTDITHATTASASIGAVGVTVPPGAFAPESTRLPDAALHVAGQRYEDGETSWVVDPWTNERIAPVICADEARARQAARAAAMAFETTR